MKSVAFLPIKAIDEKKLKIQIIQSILRHIAPRRIGFDGRGGKNGPRSRNAIGAVQYIAQGPDARGRHAIAFASLVRNAGTTHGAAPWARPPIGDGDLALATNDNIHRPTLTDSPHPVSVVPLLKGRVGNRRGPHDVKRLVPARGPPILKASMPVANRDNRAGP